MKADKIWQLGLIGFPLSHSYSPILHQTALEYLGLKGTYRLFSLSDPNQISGVVQRLRDGELDGINVTIPYKQEVINHLDGLTNAAQTIGAVNTIYHHGDKLIGDNTDASGFYYDLLGCLKGSEFVKKNALVLGSGGSAHAIAFALLGNGWSVTVTARRMAQSQALAQKFDNPQLYTTDWDSLNQSAFLKKFRLLINTTPVGMYPEVENNPIPDGTEFPQGMVVYDLICNPQETALMKLARQGGLQAFNGLGMLVN
ncbi:MAG: shikimate dehydrogenase, partial [Anaerolineaceae bacterium]|nr:shikimate dehydrogenase [Anaerolineaceae bacterium]